MQMRVVAFAIQLHTLGLWNATDHQPGAKAIVVRTMRDPNRSIRRPQGKQKVAPMSVAQRLIVAYATRSMRRSTSKGSVMRPRPCVRPGRVPTIAKAATARFTQP